MKTSVSALAIFGAAVAAVPLNAAAKIESRDLTTALYDNLKFFAQYAGASYCTNNNNNSGGLITCSNNVCPAVEANGAVGTAEFVGNPSTDQQGFVSVDPVAKLIVVSLRGTDSLINFIDDANFPFTDCSEIVAGCQAHAGFHNNWLAANSTIITGVQAAQASNPGFSVVVTGHSLGAAVATIAAAYMRQSGIPCDLYAYASPRVGNAIFADFVSAQDGVTARITHLDDIVPRLPPAVLGFRHTSPEYWLNGGNSTTDDYDISAIQVCTGDDNLTCNGGTGGLDTTAHLHYFEYISACAPNYTISTTS